MFRFVAVVTGDQLETLLLAAKAAGVTPELGVEPVTVERSQRRKSVRKRSTKRKIKRHKASLMVRVGPEPQGPPKLITLHRALKKEFGGEAFRKGLAKGVLVEKGLSSSPSQFLTKMMDGGNLVAA